MKVQVTWRRLQPDTVNGESISVTTVYSSFDKREIDAIQGRLEERCGSGVVGTAGTDESEVQDADRGDAE